MVLPFLHKKNWMEDDRAMMIDLLKSNIRDKWIKKIELEMNKLQSNQYYQKQIIILYEPNVPSLNFISLFSSTSNGYPISIEEYMIKKLRHLQLLNYIPKIEYCEDPIGLKETMGKIYLKYSKFNEFERNTYKDWELIATSGIVEEKVSEMCRTFKTSCIIHTDRSCKDIVRHEKVFYEKVTKYQHSVYNCIVIKLQSIQVNYLEPFCEYGDDPLGTNTKLFRFGVRRNPKELSPRFNKSFKSITK